jgi:hypothetical protein
VSSNVKSAILVGISILVFHTPVTAWNGVGMGLTLVGQVLYTWYSFEERRLALEREILQLQLKDLEMGGNMGVNKKILKSIEITDE